MSDRRRIRRLTTYKNHQLQYKRIAYKKKVTVKYDYNYVK